MIVVVDVEIAAAVLDVAITAEVQGTFVFVVSELVVQEA